MPIPKRWSRFTKEKIDLVPEIPGIYELGDKNSEIVDIEKGDSEKGIRTRLLAKKKIRPKSVKYFRFLEASLFESPERMEQEHGERFERKYGKLPRFQRRLPRKY